MASMIAIDRLRPEVLAVERAGFRLRDDLVRLARVAAAGAPDAIVFYAARILEALTTMEVEALTGKSASTLHSNLGLLENAGWLSPSRISFFHALRVLGNEARHIWRSLAPEDADLSLGLLERFLSWHFDRFLHCPLTDGGSFVAIDPAFLEALRLLEDPEPNLEELGRSWRAEGSVLRRVPSFAALYAEALITVGRAAEALEVADRTLGGLPSGTHGDRNLMWASVRLRQMRGQALRIVGRTDESVRELETLRHETPENEETLGILAGTYKAMSLDPQRSESERKQLMHEAAELYRKAFKRTQGTYSGINAASLSLLEGDAERASKIASQIVALYEARRGKRAPGAAIVFSGYYDCVTFAEALLLAGRLDEARRLYRSAFTQHAEMVYPIQKTRAQLRLLLERLGLGEPDAFLEPTQGGPVTRDYVPKPMDTAGVPLRDDLREAIERVAEQVHEMWAHKRFAEGWTYGPERDDQKKQHPDLVPYAELTEGEKDFDRASARETVRALLAMGYRIER
jgi:tetratricopeptide (TPR) repeat protein